MPCASCVFAKSGTQCYKAHMHDMVALIQIGNVWYILLKILSMCDVGVGWLLKDMHTYILQVSSKVIYFIHQWNYIKIRFISSSVIDISIRGSGN